jgi:hypothetical protein
MLNNERGGGGGGGGGGAWTGHVTVNHGQMGRILEQVPTWFTPLFRYTWQVIMIVLHNTT